jgi:DNA-binding XRE family transcriptional regulator
MERRRYRIDGAKVRAWRETNGMDQGTFAELLGVQPGTLCRVELGRRNASPELTLAIAERMGVGFRDITIDTMTVPVAS